MKTIRLKDLEIGEEAEIIGYAPCDPTYRNKLLSLGLTKRTRIRLIQKAPLGDPVEIEVRGFRLSLRKDEADVILLKSVHKETGESPDVLENKGMGPHRKRFRWGLNRFLRRYLFP